MLTELILYTTYPRPPGDFIDLTEKRYSRFPTAGHKPAVKLHQQMISVNATDLTFVGTNRRMSDQII